MGEALALSSILRVTLREDGSLNRGTFTPVILRPLGISVRDPAHASTRLVDQVSVQDFGPTQSAWEGRAGCAGET